MTTPLHPPSGQDRYIELALEAEHPVCQMPYNSQGKTKFFGPPDKATYDFSQCGEFTDPMTVLPCIRHPLTFENLDPFAWGRTPQDGFPLWQQIIIDDRLEPNIILNNLFAFFNISRDELSAPMVENLIELLYTSKQLADACTRVAIAKRESSHFSLGFYDYELDFLEHQRVIGGICVAIAQLAQIGQTLHPEPTLQKRFRNLETILGEHPYPLENQRSGKMTLYLERASAIGAYGRYCQAYKKFDDGRRILADRRIERAVGKSRRSATAWLAKMEKPKEK